MNVVITAIVNHTALNDTDNYKLNSTRLSVSEVLLCIIGVDISDQDGPFVWGSVVTGDVVGMFFAGYMVFQMPGGRMADRASSSLIFQGPAQIIFQFFLLKFPMF